MRFGIQPFDFSGIVSMVTEDGSLNLNRLSALSIVKRCIEKGFRVIELGLDLGPVIACPLLYSLQFSSGLAGFPAMQLLFLLNAAITPVAVLVAVA